MSEIDLFASRWPAGPAPETGLTGGRASGPGDTNLHPVDPLPFDENQTFPRTVEDRDDPTLSSDEVSRRTAQARFVEHDPAR